MSPKNCFWVKMYLTFVPTKQQLMQHNAHHQEPQVKQTSRERRRRSITFYPSEYSSFNSYAKKFDTNQDIAEDLGLHRDAVARLKNGHTGQDTFNMLVSRGIIKPDPKRNSQTAA